MTSKFHELEEDIRKILVDFPPYATEKDMIAAIGRKVRIKKSTARLFIKELKNLKSQSL